MVIQGQTMIHVLSTGLMLAYKTGEEVGVCDVIIKDKNYFHKYALCSFYCVSLGSVGPYSRCVYSMLDTKQTDFELS